MSMFAKWILPKINLNQPYKRPEMPDCFVRFSDVSITWNINSENDNDRVEYWEVDLVKYEKVADLFSLMTQEEMEIDCYGPEGKDVWLSNRQN